MRIQVDPSTSPARIELVEPDDFGSFDVLVSGDGELSAALARLGPLADDRKHVFVEPARLKELAGVRAADPGWLGGLEKMIAFASGRGWVDDAGRVRAHVSHPGS